MFIGEIFCGHPTGIAQQWLVAFEEFVAVLLALAIDAQTEQVAKQVGEVIETELADVEM